MRKIAIMTLKGGTGKTTTAVNVAHGLSLSGKRVLLIDCDPQRSISSTFGVESESGLDKLLLTGDVEILQVRDNLFVIDSGGRGLAEVEMKLGFQRDGKMRLSNALRYLKGCDYVICDCSPSINIINMNALYFSDSVVIPVSMDYLSQVGVEQTLEIINEVKAVSGRDDLYYRLLPTFYDARTRVSKLILNELKEKFGDRLFNTVVRVNSALREAPGYNRTIFEHAPLSRGAFDYYRLTEEILELE